MIDFDTAIVESPEDMEFLLALGVADWERWAHAPMFHRVIRRRFLDGLPGSIEHQDRIRRMAVGYRWLED